MQRDLENYFDYYAVVEERMFPCWKMIANKEARQKLKTKGGPESFRFIVPKADFIAQNRPLSKIIQTISNYNESEILDETGITENVDIQMNCLLKDTDDLKKALKENGLYLIQGQIAKKVLVIKEKKF